MAKRKSGDGGGGGHDGAGMMRWLLSYADMITLLMAVFIMMYSMSLLDIAKFQNFAASAKGAFGAFEGGAERISPVGELSPTGGEKPFGLETGLAEVKAFVQAQGLGESVSVRLTEEGLQIIMTDPVLFDLGRADLHPKAYPILDEIASIIKKLPGHQVRVEGHTDNLPISTPEFPSNWELSTRRAVNVLRYFVERHRIEPWRISAVGYGEFRPRYPNTTPRGRALNRRVEIVVLRK